jgi:hypothetical protein
MRLRRQIRRPRRALSFTRITLRGRSLALGAALSLLIVPTGKPQEASIKPLPRIPVVRAGSISTVSLGDDSDWWSVLRSVDSDQGIPWQEREPPPGSLKIIGVDLEKNWQMSQALLRVGPGTIVQRGDAATSRAQLCYVSEHHQGRVYLVFEGGEVAESFYLFSDGPHWKGDTLCAPSGLVSANLRNEAGLGLAETRQQVTALLGKPSLSRTDRLVYFFGVRKKTPADEFEKARRAHPEMSDKELDENYGSYDLSVSIEVRFTGTKSSYIGVTWSATY